ncbi:MAG: WG repeat-containing protein [Treponema sp.]|jgi:hypothetical protein|nr:WG repeat-containing protein [Treponema sp.]
MGKSNILIILFCAFFLFQCKVTQTESNSTKEDVTGNLVLYADYDSNGKKIWGYINEDTGKIEVEAQYESASPFVGNYAAVNRYNECLIIDKNQKTVLSRNLAGGFYDVYLVVSESGKNHLAILVNQYKRTKLDTGFNFFGPHGKPHFYKESYYKYTVINLLDGKTIIPESENYLDREFEMMGGYFRAGADLYQFLENGDVQCIAKDDMALAAGILKDYFDKLGINAGITEYSKIDYEPYCDSLRIDYEPYIKEKFADPDLEKALQDLKDLNPEFDIPFEKAVPFYRNHKMYLNAPLEITERKFLLSFRDDKTKKHAIGLYNETKTEWEIIPCYTVINKDDDEDLYYVTDIIQTNNPHLHHLRFKTDTVGWINPDGPNHSYYITMGGSIFDTVKGHIIDDLYLSSRELSAFYLFSLNRFNEIARFPGNGAYLFYDKK